jgi:flagellar motor switch protein FliM
VSMFDQEQIDSMLKASRQADSRKPGGKPRSVYPCNFRSAGRLSNENARALTAIHETFARHFASALDVYLGSGLEVKFQALDQLPIKDHISSIPPLSYIAPCSLSTVPSTMIVECDIHLVFPIIDLLMGGSGGGPVKETRELSEIEEEIMHDVTTLIARQAENAWRMPSMSLVPNRRIKASVLHQYCPPNEKVTLVKFEIEIAGVTGSLQLVFPTLFLNILIKQIKMEQPQKKRAARFFPTPSLRDRILDCDFEVAAELLNIKVAVKDLISLQPGSVLKLRAPVRSPGKLTVKGEEVFEAVPVRNGTQKAAQLGRRAQRSSWEGE